MDLSDVDRPKERWFKFGDVEFFLRYASPRESDRFHARLTRNGIGRRDRDGFLINPGREADFYEAMAEQYVMDWRGNITVAGKAEPYSAQVMAKFLAGRRDLLKAISDAIQEDQAFFAPEPNGSTPS